MRTARLKVDEQATWYHCFNRIAGRRTDLPFGDKEKEQFLRILKRCCQLYTVEVVGYCIMSNHYHLIVRAPSETPKPAEVCKRYHRFHRGQRTIRVDSQDCQLWQARCRDISWFLRHVQQLFAIWYNNQNDRRGALWGDRFKNVILEDGRAVWECWTYVENNPVRAGIVTQAAEYRFSSYGAWRQSGRHPFRKSVSTWALPMLRDLWGIQQVHEIAKIMGHSLHAKNPAGPQENIGIHTKVRFWTQGWVIGSQLFIAQVMRRRETSARIQRNRCGQLELNGGRLYAWRNVRPLAA